MKFSKEIDNLVQQLARLPGIGPRSARRIAFYLLTQKLDLAEKLAETLRIATEKVVTCSTCGNLDTQNPCQICSKPDRNQMQLCVVGQIGDLWAIEKSGIFSGLYQVLGGNLSAIDKIGPDQLRINQLLERITKESKIQEVILALNFTLEGKVTSYYLVEQLKKLGIKVTELAHGIPVGGELDYMDSDTLTAALRSRNEV